MMKNFANQRSVMVFILMACFSLPFASRFARTQGLSEPGPSIVLVGGLFLVYFGWGVLDRRVNAIAEQNRRSEINKELDQLLD